MEAHGNTRLDTVSRYGLIILAVVQGFALYLLHLSIDHEAWPATDPRWLMAFYALVGGLPVFFYLGLERVMERRNAWAAAAVGPLLFGLGWHLGWLRWGAGLELPDRSYFTFIFFVSIGISLFILALYFRIWCINRTPRFDYRQLLEHSWQHALTLALLGLFLGTFWLLLLLWGALFDIIGISFFEELFEEPIFLYPASAFVGGWGLVLIRERIRLVATVQSMCEVLIKALLPLAALIGILFLGALPFTGVARIWETGHAALLMMSLATVLLFFFNSVLSENPDHPPYPAWMHGLVIFGVLLLPLNSLLAAWALGLRIEQYGLTVDRLWAATIQLLLAGFTLSYSVLILLRRTRALGAIQNANKILAFVVAGVLILVNTPAADMRAWAAESQANRLLNGEVDADSFDYNYLRFSLGAYGVMELRKLQGSEFAKQNPLVADRIDAVLKQDTPWQHSPVVDKNNRQAVADMFMVIPQGTSIPEPLLDMLAKGNGRCLSTPKQCQLVRAPFHGGSVYWLLLTNRHGSYVSGSAYSDDSGHMEVIGRLSSPGCRESSEAGLTEDTKLAPVESPFVAFTDGQCFYLIQPDINYFRGLTSQPLQTP